jgi:hypothetical protein
MGRSPFFHLYIEPILPRDPITCLQNLKEGQTVVFPSKTFTIAPILRSNTGIERSCSSYGKAEVYLPYLDMEYVVGSAYSMKITNNRGVFQHNILELLSTDPNSENTWLLTTEGHILNCESFSLRGVIEINT